MTTAMPAVLLEVEPQQEDGEQRARAARQRVAHPQHREGGAALLRRGAVRQGGVERRLHGRAAEQHVAAEQRPQRQPQHPAGRARVGRRTFGRVGPVGGAARGGCGGEREGERAGRHLGEGVGQREA